MTMDIDEIRRHWTDWAVTYGSDLKATTKTWTAKTLEIDALIRHVRAVVAPRVTTRALEIGCGNGINCVELAKAFPEMEFDGVDLIPEMMSAAERNSAAAGVGDRTRFFIGDALAIDEHAQLYPSYDIVFTDRCLINLNTIELQKRGISIAASKVRVGGHLLLIENSRETYDEQNRCRRLVGLQPRQPAPFNLFFDENEIRMHIAAIGLELLMVEDFISLHDLVLYVLVPAINGGHIDYEHPLVNAATLLSKKMSSTKPNAFGAYGQNRLFVCRRRG